MDTEIYSQISFYSILWYFFIYSFLGWCLEVVFCSANTGKFVNRGFLNGPVCPIYGFGGTFIILLLLPAANNILLLFTGSIIVTSILELITGYLLNRFFHTRWWDYSEQPFNIGGYICLKFSLAWGVAGVFVMKVIHPVVAGFVGILPRFLGIALLVIFSAVFLFDFIVTLIAMLKLRKDLDEITRIAQSLHKGSDVLAKSLGNRAISVADKLEELQLQEQTQKARQKWEEGKDKWEEKRKAMHQKHENAALAQKLEQLVSRNERFCKHLVKSFPDAKNTKFSDAWEHLKNRILTPPDDSEKEDASLPEDSGKTDTK